MAMFEWPYGEPTYGGFFTEENAYNCVYKNLYEHLDCVRCGENVYLKKSTLLLMIKMIYTL